MQINMWIGIYVEECLKQRLSTVPTAFATKNSLPTASSVQSETQALDKQSYFEPVLYNHHQRSCHWTIIWVISSPSPQNHRPRTRTWSVKSTPHHKPSHSNLFRVKI